LDQASGATGVKEEQGAASTSPIEDFLTADNVSEYGRRTHTEEEIVKYLKTLIVALGVTMVLPMAARSADKTALRQSARGSGRATAARIPESSLQAPRAR
jgi:hypothetical protein